MFFLLIFLSLEQNFPLNFFVEKLCFVVSMLCTGNSPIDKMILQRWSSLWRDCPFERSPTYQLSQRTFCQSRLPVSAIRDCKSASPNQISWFLINDATTETADGLNNARHSQSWGESFPRKSFKSIFSMVWILEISIMN